MTQWTGYLAELLQHDAQTREQQNKIADLLNPQRHYITPHLPGSPSTGRPLLLNFHTISPRKGVRAQAYNDIFVFLTTLSVTPPTDHDSIGISWLKLFFLFSFEVGPGTCWKASYSLPHPHFGSSGFFKLFNASHEN